MTDELPTVTVVIPTHNRRHLLPDAIDSVFAQDGVDARVIVVNDASTDGTADWVRTRAGPGLELIDLAATHERTRARNLGLDATRTPLVLFLDDDDVLMPRALERLALGLQRSPTAPVAAGGYVTFGTYAGLERPRTQRRSPVNVTRRMWVDVLCGWYKLPGASLWRTASLRELGGWDETLNYAEDLELALRMHPQPVMLLRHAVLNYRQHGREVAPETRETWLAMEHELRERFVGSLPSAERAIGERILASRDTFENALAAYQRGEYRVARAGLVTTCRTAPERLRSPIYGPWTLALIAKSLLGGALPTGLARRVRASRGRARADAHQEAVR